MNGLISVCIPTFEQPQLAVRAASSALRQTGCKIEVIVTDDSRDQAVADALRPLRDDPRLTYVRNTERLGAVANWNKGLGLARGDVVKLLHHDDWFGREDTLARMTAPILSGEVKATFCDCNNVLPDGTSTHHAASPAALEAFAREPTFLVLGNVIGDPSVCTFARSMDLAFDERFLWLSDIDFHIRLAERCGSAWRYVADSGLNVSAGAHWQISRLYDHGVERALPEYVLMTAKHGPRMAPDTKQRAENSLISTIASLPPAVFRKLVWTAISTGDRAAVSLLLRLYRLSLRDKSGIAIARW